MPLPRAPAAASAAMSSLSPALLPIGGTSVCGPALSLRLDGECGRARATTLRTPHGAVRTPVFMPVGTSGSVKGVSPLALQLPPLDCEIILANTYHLGDRPGGAALAALGGAHGWMGWPRALLTDSGGFQMVSLLALAEITEEGVTFASPVDGARSLLTPEASMALQAAIGADVAMALDDVVSSASADDARFALAMERTLRWLDRCIAAQAPAARAQSLFAIAQGGLDVSRGGLRERCLAGLLARDAALPGYAIGGLAGGEAKAAFWRVVDHGAARLPRAKPRYLMGVGYPLDIVVCSALGIDMYDCVYPTRTGRFGTAMVHGGTLRLRAAAYAGDSAPIDATCACHVCARYTRAHIHAMLRAREPSSNAAQLVTHHNIAYMMRLVREMRNAILAGSYAHYVTAFVHNMFARGVVGEAADEQAAAAAVAVAAADTIAPAVPDDDDGGAAVAPGGLAIPGWVVEAADAAGIDVRRNTAHAETRALFDGTPAADSVPSADAGERRGGSRPAVAAPDDAAAAAVAAAAAALAVDAALPPPSKRRVLGVAAAGEDAHPS